MKIRIINEVSSKTWHETENILEAERALTWLLPHPDFINEKEIIIRVCKGDE